MLGDCVTEMELEYKRDLIAADSFIVEAYDTVGKEVIEKLKYSKKKITEAMSVIKFGGCLRIQN